jgi:hypothetical protein
MMDLQALIDALPPLTDEEQRLLTEETPVPAQMTQAFNLRELEGPEVDEACGAAEPAVDRWEAGLEVPTSLQVRLMAQLTRCRISWFYQPVREEERSMTIRLCYRSRRRHVADVVTTTVDERGVLHTDVAEVITEPRPRTPAQPVKAQPAPAPQLPDGRHAPVIDPDTGRCQTGNGVVPMQAAEGVRIMLRLAGWAGLPTTTAVTA